MYESALTATEGGRRLNEERFSQNKIFRLLYRSFLSSSSFIPSFTSKYRSFTICVSVVHRIFVLVHTFVRSFFVLRSSFFVLKLFIQPGGMYGVKHHCTQAPFVQSSTIGAGVFIISMTIRSRSCLRSKENDLSFLPSFT